MLANSAANARKGSNIMQSTSDCKRRLRAAAREFRPRIPAHSIARMRVVSRLQLQALHGEYQDKRREQRPKHHSTIRIIGKALIIPFNPSLRGVE